MIIQTKYLLYLFFAVGLALPIPLDADLIWPISVKVVLDENGDRFTEVCSGGTDDGDPCDPNIQCPGGSCVFFRWFGSVRETVCDGGPSDGLVCDQHQQCSVECLSGDLNTDAEIERKIRNANEILSGDLDEPGVSPTVNGVPRTEERGYLFRVDEIIDLSDLPSPPSDIRACSEDSKIFCFEDSDCSGTCDQVDHWFYAPIDKEVRAKITDLAESDKDTWAWKDDITNIYILGTWASGCADERHLVLLGQALNAIETPFHEIGHFMDLQHTVNTDDCYTIANDGVDDTIEDHQGDGCSWDQNDIAEESFPTVCAYPDCYYLELTDEQKLQVDQAYYNLMTIRYRRWALTPGQLDRMTDESNEEGRATGKTVFVDRRAIPGDADGSSVTPYATVGTGISNANPGDIVLIRSGWYDESLLIDEPVYLRSSRGSVVIE